MQDERQRRRDTDTLLGKKQPNAKPYSVQWTHFRNKEMFLSKYENIHISHTTSGVRNYISTISRFCYIIHTEELKKKTTFTIKYGFRHTVFFHKIKKIMNSHKENRWQLSRGAAIISQDKPLILVTVKLSTALDQKLFCSKVSKINTDWCLCLKGWGPFRLRDCWAAWHKLAQAGTSWHKLAQPGAHRPPTGSGEWGRRGACVGSQQPAFAQSGSCSREEYLKRSKIKAESNLTTGGS